MPEGPCLSGVQRSTLDPRRRSLAFTIVELMLAIGIFMMIILAVYSTWAGILKATRACRSAADSAQRARISMRAIEDALLTVQMFTANMPPQGQEPYYAFRGENSGDFGELSFVAHLPATFPGVGRFGDNVVRRVSFTCEREKDGTIDLIMKQEPMLEAMEEGHDPYVLVLARDVQMFLFEFWGQEDPIKKPEWKWIDKWESSNSIPALVRIGLSVGKTGKKGEGQDLVMKVVALPAHAVQPEWQNPLGVPGGVRPGMNPGQIQPGSRTGGRGSLPAGGSGARIQ